MKRTRQNRIGIVAGALASVVVSGAVMGEIRAGTASGPGAGAEISTLVITSEDGERIEIVVREDKVDARLNGLRIAPDRVRREGDTITILGEDGEAIRTLNLAPKPGVFMTPTPPTPPGYSMGGGLSVEATPPVMLGVTLSSVGEALQAQLGVSPHAILIDDVLAGLPADKAGLRRWDIITAVDGESLDDTKSLHGSLKTSKPGETMRLGVVRQARELEIEVELAAYDAGALSRVERLEFQTEAPAPGVWGLFSGRGEHGLDAAREALLAAQRRLEEIHREHGDLIDADKIRRDIEQAMRELQSRRHELPSMFQWRFDDQGRLLRVPGGEGEAPREGRLEELEKRFEERLGALEHRWSGVESMFDRMLERLEEALAARRGEDPESGD